MSRLNYRRPIESNRIPASKFTVHSQRTFLDFESIFISGRYAGKTVQYVFDNDFQYLFYAFRSHIFYFSQGVIDQIKFNRLQANREARKQKPKGRPANNEPKYFIFNTNKEEVARCNNTIQIADFCKCSLATVKKAWTDGRLVQDQYYISKHDFIV